MKKLSEGTGNLISRSKKLKELGANTRKELPQKIIDKASNEN